VAEEIDLEMRSYEQLSEVQILRDLVLDLGSGAFWFVYGYGFLGGGKR